MAPRIYSMDSLFEHIQKGASFEYLLFYGHKASPDGQVTASCFSQWFPAPFAVDDQNYPTAEHFMMAEKARLFKDAEMLNEILTCKSPMEAKRFGRKVRGFNPAVWEKERTKVVVMANLSKFGQNPEMKRFLLDSAPKVLVEASPRDRIWGIGLGRENVDAQDPRKWRGKNLLGFALIQVRDELAGS